MEKSQNMENIAKLHKQLEDIKPVYYKLWDDIESMYSNLRVHMSTVVAAFLGIIASLHQSGNNICKEWVFFSCVALCVLSLVCLLISSFENLHNSIALRDIVKSTCDKAIENMTPLDNLTFSSPRRKIYSILFWFGIMTFGIAIILFCLINMPIW